MEASDNTTPSSQPSTTPPPPPEAPAGETGKSSAGVRLLAVVLALALAFGAAVMIVLPLNPDDTPRCEQALGGECFDLSENQQLIQNIFAWPAGILGGIAAILCLYLAATGRGAGLVRKVAIPAIVLGLIAVAIGQL